MPFETFIAEMAMPTSPHRRQPSELSIRDASPSARFSHNHHQSRRSSAAFSQHSPVSRRFSQDPEDAVDASGLGGGGDDLGNLADELADAWSGEEEEYDEGETLDNIQEDYDGVPDLDGSSGSPRRHAGGALVVDAEKTRDSGIDVSSSPPPSQKQHGSLGSGSAASPQQPGRQDGRHQRHRSNYDGSDYGEESDLEEAPLISRSLEAEMASIEGLARRGLEVNGSASDTIIEKMVNGLRDLGSQSAAENGATRLSTAQSAVATHLTHQTRQLASLLTALISPLSAPPPPDLIDDLQPLLEPLMASINELQPTGTPLHAIHTLNRSTADLISTLSYLGDTLHMSKQATNTAARRLRTVREAMAEWRQESDLREEGVRFIERGQWDRRLQAREAGTTCQKVVGGFEEACERWRERLVGQLGVEAVA